MKSVVAAIIHIVAILLITFSYGPLDWLFNVNSAESARYLHFTMLGAGFLLFYLTHAVMLKEAWKNKNLSEIKIFGLF
jgi:hypothetical protein